MVSDRDTIDGDDDITIGKALAFAAYVFGLAAFVLMALTALGFGVAWWLAWVDRWPWP
jgi:hypothetical protein